MVYIQLNVFRKNGIDTYEKPRDQIGRIIELIQDALMDGSEFDVSYIDADAPLAADDPDVIAAFNL